MFSRKCPTIVVFWNFLVFFAPMCYHESMSNKYSTKLPLSLEICGIKLNIFEPGWQLQREDGARKEDRQNSPHSHFAFEVFFAAEGELVLVTGRNTQVYERKIVIVPPKCRHYSIRQSGWGLCLLFAFDAQQALLDERIGRILYGLGGAVCAFALDEDTALYARMAAQALKREDALSAKETELLIGLLFCRFLAKLLPDEKLEQPTRSRGKHINAIESYINANIYQPITPADVAENVYLSVRQVSRIVEREYHCTLRQFIVDRKLDAAEALIKNTDTKVAQVASMLQLGSDNYFYALFKKRFGMTPLQYRKASKSDQ